MSVATTEPTAAQSAMKSTFVYSDPSELQFSCAVFLNAQEEALAGKLSKGSAEERVAAARDLWNGHSRRHAGHVIEFILGRTSQTDSMAALKHIVEDSLKPEAILRELRQDDNLWGLWLAFLHPHEALVPDLLADLIKKPQNRPEVILALGKSGDPRALQPLLHLVDDSDYRIPGDAANALRYMTFPAAEQKLIEALSRDNGWLKVKACSALGKVGCPRALPALERIAKDRRSTGALSIRSTATCAIEAIVKRNPEPTGAGQPATQPSDKSSAKDQLSPPTSKDRPR